MIPTDPFVDVLKTALGVILGTIVSMVATGFMFKYFVLDKAMENKKVKKLMGNVDRIIDDLDLALDKMEKLLENGKTVQEPSGKESLPEASDYKS